jgi:NADH dehydrogenase [ubiquinone] 1 alpha subcomplex assembly factor 1
MFVSTQIMAMSCQLGGKGPVPVSPAKVNVNERLPRPTTNISRLEHYTNRAMFATPILRAAAPPGFWKRSMDEFKRQAKIAIRMEGLHSPTKPFTLIKFDKEDSIPRCKIMCDSDMGGFSKAALTFVPGTTTSTLEEESSSSEKSSSTAVEGTPSEPAHALFKGSISTELPHNRPNVQRSGYAAWRTQDRGLSLFGKLLWDIDPYAFLTLKVKSDGRKYFVNIQTESIVPTDLHQHLLPCAKPGEWETVTIPFSAFVRTNFGMVVEPQREMMRQKVRSIGIGLIDRVPGPFELRIADVFATNRPPKREVVDSGFDIEEEEKGMGMMDEVDKPRKKGEPEKILI